MKTTYRIAIVAALALAVAAVLLVKQRRMPQAAARAAHTTNAPALAAAQGAATRLPRLVDLGADKCIPCKAMAPVLDELKREYAGVFDVQFVDVWRQPDDAKPYNIKLIPTQIFYDAAGNELFRHEGFFAKEDILLQWEKLGYTLRH